ncbi:hypothetical protein [Streptomyces filipinensis]|uniref:hypothetical protein n=1 Tax=Streptomyces filipinensis TaxID=66887 RepID=UPI00178618F4|nr:hypothetical protein [Streptomyces filipinensis]
MGLAWHQCDEENPVLPGDDPTEAYYGTDTKVTLGDPLPLPAPYPTLDTTPFLDD